MISDIRPAVAFYVPRLYCFHFYVAAFRCRGAMQNDFVNLSHDFIFYFYITTMDFIVQSFKRGDAVVASPFLYLKTKSDGNVSHWLCCLVQPPGDEHIFQHRFFVPY